MRPHRYGYRNDIQGLRGLAVLMVVLYHAKVHPVAGGYVGVDVFFVISGYLITSLLVREYEEHGRIDLCSFYSRRIRRLLPVSSVVFCVTVVTSVVVLPPVDVERAHNAMLATATYMSNVYFAVAGFDYLAVDSAESPFQQYWSLSLEEQFYLAWPGVLVLALSSVRSRIGSRLRVATVLTMIVLGSFLVSIRITNTAGSYAYFLLPARAWELALGGLVAIMMLGVRIPPRTGSRLVVVGVLGALLSAIVLDEDTAFPGYAALLPVLSTSLVLIGGAADRDRVELSVVERVLRSGPLTRLGSISYSLYLWHWPALVLPQLALLRPLSATERVIGVGVALMLAVITYHFVEEPARRQRLLAQSPARSFTFGIVVTVASVAVALSPPVRNPFIDTGAPATVIESGELPRLIDNEPTLRELPSNLAPGILNAREDQPAHSKDGCDLHYGDAESPPCRYGSDTNATTVVLFGDSHAAQWFPALEAVAHSIGYELVVLTKNACSSYGARLEHGALVNDCEVWRRNSLDRIASLKPDVVVLANYSELTEGWVQWRRSVYQTVAELSKSASVVILGKTPQQKYDVTQCLSARVGAVERCSTDASMAIDSAVVGAEHGAAVSIGQSYVDTTRWLCSVSECPPIVGNVLLYRDSHHLTGTASRLLAPQVLSALSAHVATSHSKEREAS